MFTVDHSTNPWRKRVRTAGLLVVASVGAIFAGQMIGRHSKEIWAVIGPAKPPAPPKPEDEQDARPKAIEKPAPSPFEPPHLFEGAAEGAAFVQPVELVPPHVVVDANTITSSGTIVRLAYIEGVGHGDVCINDEGLKFACGLQGRASLQNLIRDATVTCQPVYYPSDENRYRCRSDGIDLSEHQVQSGFAHADGMAQGRYELAEAEAKESRRGAWDGGWDILLARSKAPALPAPSMDSRAEADEPEGP